MNNVDMLQMDIFPVPFTVVNLGESSREMNKLILKIMYDEMDRFPSNPLRSNIGGWQNTNNLDEVYPEFKDILDNKFFPIVEPTIKRIGLKGDIRSQVRLEGVWANITDNPHSYHLPHFHGFGETILNAVYYPSSGFQDGKEVSKNQDLNQPIKIYSSSRPEPGDIAFMDPSVNIKRQVYNNNFDRYPYFGLEICVTPKEGVLIIAPHYLTHFVVPHEKPGFTRHSITFDIKLNR